MRQFYDLEIHVWVETVERKVKKTYTFEISVKK